MNKRTKNAILNELTKLDNKRKFYLYIYEMTLNAWWAEL